MVKTRTKVKKSVAAQKDWIPTRYDLRDTWFPIAHAPHVTAKVVRRIIHAQPVFLWRDQGRAIAAEIHPETRASEQSRPSEFTNESGLYPIAERYGYIWIWYGHPDSADQTLLPHIPFLPADGSIPNFMRTTIRFDACSALSVENLLDLTHADFLHGELVGGEGVSETDEVSFEYTSETLTRTRMVTGKPVSPIMRWIGGVRSKYQDFQSILHVHLRSNLCISYPRFTPGIDVPNVQPFVPVGQNRSRVDQIFNLTAAPLPFRRLMPRIAYTVGPQDNYVMRPQNPAYLHPSTRRDFHSRFDAPGTRYRYLMEKLHQRQSVGDYSYQNDGDPGADITQILGMDKPVQ